MRKVIYVSGTRADFGLMHKTLQGLHARDDIDLQICVTAQHLLAEHGMTVNDIEASGFKICAKIPVLLDQTGPAMSRAIGHEMIGYTDVFLEQQPDLILLLGDRGEMLAAALTAVHLNIHVAHVHGGERSGTVDEMVRHCTSKLSHFHFVATQSARERLIKMGEQEACVTLVGAPGLDDIVARAPQDKLTRFTPLGLDPNKPTALFIYHPVVQEEDTLETQTKNAIEAALEHQLQLVCLTPNSDAGGNKIAQILKSHRDTPGIALFEHFERPDYIDWLLSVDLIIGNSSSGIIEAASAKCPVVNVGSRQNLRDRSENVIDVSCDKQAIHDGIATALSIGRRDFHNVFGDGHSSERIIKQVCEVTLDPELLKKSNTY